MADLTTLAAVKLYLTKVDNGDDAVIQSLITAYSEWVRSYTNFDFSVQAYNIWRDGKDFTQLAVMQWPIVSISSLTVDGRSIPPQASFGAYGYRFTEKNVILEGGARFTWGTENINLQYTAGFATIPADIAQAVTELVALRFKLRDKLEWKSKTLAGETVTLNTDAMPASVETVLSQYANRVPL